MKRLILVMKKYIIEPLGVMHLAGIAKQRGWDVSVFLYENFDFEPLYEEIKSFKPDLVGFSIWTGAHLQSFRAADRVLAMGVPVAIGGPHATYFTEDCTKHASMVAKGDAFKIFDGILSMLEGREMALGVHRDGSGAFFDPQPKATDFPLPYRDAVYHRYPDLAASPIKSMMCSTGCPFHCTYCNSPHLNDMYGGFGKVFRVRPIGDLIREALDVRDKWGVKMFYFQDDIFGYRLDWLEEFVRRWKAEVGVSWHCQIRLELTQGDAGMRRLELFRKGGCTGITLAIESGNDFLRKFVLLRPMEHELIVDGCKRIMDLELTLRTEQILQIPFSSLETDLGTLKLNNEINPQMSWSSILAPFGETNMGRIANRFRFYLGNNDDLDEVFYFDHSQLRHSDHGLETVEPFVLANAGKRFESPLLNMWAEPSGQYSANVFHEDLEAVSFPGNGRKPVCELRYLSDTANARYCEQGSRLQRIFNWLSKVPEGHRLGARWVDLPKDEWTFANLGKLTDAHLEECGYGEKMVVWKHQLASRLGCSPENLPAGIRDNPLYFSFFPSGHELAKRIQEKNIFELEPWKFFDALGGEARRWLFSRYVYKTDLAEAPISRA